MAEFLTCKICRSTFEDGDRQAQTEDGADEPFKTLMVKLLSIGFFQGGIESTVPFHLCPWCAARVEDAYDLQQQCLQASQALKKMGTCESVKETLMDEVTNEKIEMLQGLSKNMMPGLIRLSPKGSPNIKTVSNVLAGAQNMFVCIRNLSTSLKVIATLLTNAVQFTENTLSFITVLLSMNENSAAMAKSAQVMRKDAKTWKTTSAMISDATSFIECVSPSNAMSFKRTPLPPKDVQIIEEEPQQDAEKSHQDSEKGQKNSELIQSTENLPSTEKNVESIVQNIEELPQNEEDVRQNAEESQQDTEGMQQDAGNLQQQSPKAPEQCTVELEFPESGPVEPLDVPETVQDLSLTKCLEPSNNNGINSDAGVSEDIMATLEEQNVRRSSRSRSMVDTLVYWPKFKKQAPACDKLTVQKSMPSDPPLTCSQALDRLLLRRDVESDADPTNIEKWAIVKAIVKKRKSLDGNGPPKKRKEIQPESNVSTSPLSNRLKDLVQNHDEASQDGMEEKDLEDTITRKLDRTIKQSISNDVPAVNSDNQVNLDDEELPVPDQDDKTSLLMGRTCNICGKSLKSSRNLQAHMNMHTGSSQYQCNYCPKLFTSSWNRIQHERVHTGIKPYKCDMCDEAFRYNVSLRNHKVKAHV